MSDVRVAEIAASVEDLAVLDFLEDCASVRAFSKFDVAEHYALLAELVSSNRIPQSMSVLADNLRRALALKWGHPLEPDEGRVLARTTLNSIHDLSRGLGRPVYVFHGTTASRLDAIMREGLVPGRGSPWERAGDEVISQCREFTFFTEAWTPATDYAHIAHCRMRGPKTSWNRTPVVLRLPMTGLALNRDPLASKPNCWRVMGPVSAATAEVRFSPFSGVSRWLPIREAGRKPPPKKRRA